MKVTLTSTSKIVILKPGLLSDGLPARVWVGETESGVKVHAFITRIAVAKDQDTEQFERELQQCETPSVEVQAIPKRLVDFISKFDDILKLNYPIQTIENSCHA